jgi:hypothetical protein
LIDSPTAAAAGTLPGRARAPGRPTTVARGSRHQLWAAGPHRPRPLLDSEPRRTPGLEVKPSNISLTPPSTRLDLPLVPPRQHPGTADPRHTIRRRRPDSQRSPYQLGYDCARGRRRNRARQCARRLARKGSKSRLLGRWRDPDSNQRHHDFSEPRLFVIVRRVWKRPAMRKPRASGPTLLSVRFGRVCLRRVHA